MQPLLCKNRRFLLRSRQRLEGSAFFLRRMDFGNILLRAKSQQLGGRKMKRPIDRENLASEAPPRMVYANSNFAPAWGVLGATRGNFSTPPVSRFEPEASSMQPWDPARASQPVGRTGRYVGWLGKGCSRWEYKMLTRDTPTCFSPVRPTG